MPPEDAAHPTPTAPTPTPTPAAPTPAAPADGVPPENNAAARSPEGNSTLPTQPADGELLSFTCPRCRLEVTEELYGPCGSCRTTLRAVIGGEARQVEQQDYVPKMNVTPNAVASKD